jgi:biopolymer transport protein ExbB/TolQ
MTIPATSTLADALARIASALLIPVLALALIALLVCGLEAGRFAGEAWVRRRAGKRALRDLVLQVQSDPGRAPELANRAPSRLSGDALVEIAQILQHREPGTVRTALADFELAVQRRMERTRVLVRAGPALGLMGTLIPLAPGLAALGQGDAATLASDLRTAFAATTIGLLVGTCAYAITLVRTRMYGEDLAALEHFELSTGTAQLNGDAPTGAEPSGSRLGA